jgi:hypothetical protein
METGGIRDYFVSWRRLVRGAYGDNYGWFINSALSLLTPPVTIEVSPNIGALVAASISVAILLRILSKSKNGSLPGLDGGDE